MSTDYKEIADIVARAEQKLAEEKLAKDTPSGNAKSAPSLLKSAWDYGASFLSGAETNKTAPYRPDTKIDEIERILNGGTDPTQYIALGEDLGIKFLNQSTPYYHKILKSYNAPNAPLDINALVERHKIPVAPESIHHGAVLAEALVGISTKHTAQKSFLESSYRTAATNGNFIGPYQMNTVSAKEGLEYLLKIPNKAEIEKAILWEYKKQHGEDASTDSLKDLSKNPDLMDWAMKHEIASAIINAGYVRRYMDAAHRRNPDAVFKAVDAHTIHFLGPGNAMELISARTKNPDTPVVDILRNKEAVLSSPTNQKMLLKEDGTPRTITEYSIFLEVTKGLTNHVVYDPNNADSAEIEIVTGEQASTLFAQNNKLNNAEMTQTIPSP